MTTNRVDTLVTDYLDRLNRAAQVLPPDRREDLLGEISEHIAAAQAAGAAADEAAVRTLLDRLGSPEEIVDAARDEPTLAGAASGPGWGESPYVTEVQPSTTLETWAVVMLTLGSLIPFVGWLVGVVLLWLSQRWRWWEKAIGTLVVPFGPGVVLFISALSVRTTECSASATSTSTSGGGSLQGPTECTSSGPPAWLGLVIVIVAIVGPLVVAAVLLKVARARARQEPPVMQSIPPALPPGTSPWTGLEIAAVLVLGVGAFVVPVVGPIVGLALAWSSPRWTDSEKTTATLIAAIPGALLLLGSAALFMA